MKSEEIEQLTEAASEKLFNLPPVKFELDITLTVGLIGQLQLAFRHPANVGPTRKMLERFVRETIEKLDPSKGEAYQFLMMGFEEKYDA